MGDKNKIKYGLKNVYYAKATFDDDGAVFYEAPVHIPGAVSLSLDAEGEVDPWYADNTIYVTLSNNAGYSGDLEVALIPGSFYEDILHEERNADNLLLENTNVEVEHFALMFQFQGDKKAIRHVLYNCTCSRPAIESATTEDTKEPQTDTLTLTAYPLRSGYVKAKTGEDTDAQIYDGWFDDVYLPGNAPVKKTYTVEFYDGDALLETVTEVPYGSSVSYSGEEPSKTGYTFIGWNPNPTYVTSDMKCYAVYQIKTFTVEFWNGDELLQSVTVEYGGSTIYIGPTPTREGYVFTEWAPEPTNITEDTKCYAQFKVATLTVEFWNGDKLLESVVVEYGKDATYSGTEPEKEGYTFTGWSPDPTNVTEDLKCEAQFQINTFTVEFWNGDDLLETVTVGYGNEAVYSGAEPEKEGYTFTGWSPEPVNVTTDMKCYAQFQINVYTVEFWNDDDLLESVSVEYGGTVVYTGEEPEKEGYNFTGWDPEPTEIKKDTRCYAQFQIKTFTVDFYNGDELLETVMVEYGKDAIFSGTEPEKEGYIFIGWNPEPVNVTEDMKSEAQFQIKTYTVEFWNEDELLQTVIVEHGGTAVYTGEGPEKEGYVFTGWDPEPTNVTDDMKCFAQFEEEVIGFAVYSEDDSSLTFYADSEAPEAGEVYKDKKATAVYTEVENTSTSGASYIPWYSNRKNVVMVSFDESFESVQPANTAFWFYEMTNCSKIDLTNLNTGAVGSMSYMFYDCVSLEELDVSELDTSSVIGMNWMFNTCSQLKTIYSDDSRFVTDKVRSGTSMFSNCRELVGGNGTTYSTGNASYTMAHVDTEENPGYFTAKN